MEINSNRSFLLLTVKEFKEIFREAVQSKIDEEDYQKTDKRFVYGISGIAEIYDCSLSTAHRIKSSGKINKAISQAGKKIVVDVDLALELYKRK